MLRFRTNTNLMFAKTEGGSDEKSYLSILKEGVKSGGFILRKGTKPGIIVYMSEIDQKITGNTTLYLTKGFYVVYEP